MIAYSPAIDLCPLKKTAFLAGFCKQRNIPPKLNTHYMLVKFKKAFRWILKP